MFLPVRGPRHIAGLVDVAAFDFCLAFALSLLTGEKKPFEPDLPQKIVQQRGGRNSTASKVLALHAAGQGSSSATHMVPQALQGAAAEAVQ